MHFDWWMFPIDDGSMPEYNVGGQDDINELKSDAEWHERYRESVKLAAKAWGWDVETGKRITGSELQSGMGEYLNIIL